MMIVDPSRYNVREWAVRQQWRLGVQAPEGRATSCLPPASPPLVSFSDGEAEVSRVLDVGFVLDVVVRSLCSRLSEPDLQSFRAENPLIWAMCIEPEALSAMLSYQYLCHPTCCK